MGLTNYLSALCKTRVQNNFLPFFSIVIRLITLLAQFTHSFDSMNEFEHKILALNVLSMYALFHSPEQSPILFFMALISISSFALSVPVVVYVSPTADHYGGGQPKN